MKKAVFFDIDGTLWDDDMRISESTVASIRALRERGSYAFLCSGRSRVNICSEALLGIGFDGVVASCGAHIDFQGEKIFEKLLSREEVAHALGVMESRRALIVLDGPEYAYVNLEDFGDNPYVSYLRRELGESLKNLREYTEYEINKLSVEISDGSTADIPEALGDRFDVIFHNECLMEIVPKGFSKASGIEKVCGLLGIARGDTYAFGDSANDLEMLKYVAHGIAMGNGTAAAKEAAEYVTTDIRENGIENGLRHYGLIA